MKFRSRQQTWSSVSTAVSRSSRLHSAELARRAVARGPSAMLTRSIPPAARRRAASSVRLGSVPAGEESSQETANSPRASLAPRRLRCDDGTGGRATGAALAPAGAPPVTCEGIGRTPIMRTAPSIRRVCSGVVPQQPPTMRTPACSARRAQTPKCSGLAM